MRTARIADARVVTPDGVVEGDVTYEVPREDRGGWHPAPLGGGDGSLGRPEVGRILEVGRCSTRVDETYDARGAWVVPGGIDAHVHFGGFGDIPIADDFYQGSRAALAGGTTTVIDFVEPEGPETVRQALVRRLRDAATSAVDYAFRLVLTEDYERQLADVPLAEATGIHDFKLFTVYEGETLSPDDLEAIFSRLGGDPRRTFLVHAEDPEQIGRLRAARGDTADFLDLARTRPPEGEERMARMLRDLVGRTGARVCMAHVTCAGTVALLDGPAPARGEFALETCPHYLAFDESVLTGEDGWRYTMTPPLRSSEHVSALWDHLLSGSLPMLSTDHCPYASRFKRDATYQTVPCGVDGVGTRMAWAYGQAVVARGMDMVRFVDVTSANAARFYGLWPRKGAIATGSDADLAVIADESWEVRVHDMPDALDYSIWEGMPMAGRVVRTVCGGALAFDGRRVLACPGTGRLLDKTRMGD